MASGAFQGDQRRPPQTPQLRPASQDCCEKTRSLPPTRILKLSPPPSRTSAGPSTLASAKRRKTFLTLAIGAKDIPPSASRGSGPGTRYSPLRLRHDDRRLIYTTNGVGAVNSKLPCAVRAKGHFPTEEAAPRIDPPESPNGA
jgi:hypothetical protein